MPALAILFWLILLTGFLGCWLACLVGWLTGRKRKIRWLKWFAGVPLVAMTGLGLFAAGAVIWGFYRSSSPPHVFEASFGFSAPTTTKFKSGSSWVFADSGDAEICFITDTNTIERIIKTGFVEISQEEFQREQQIIPKVIPTRYFRKSPFGKGFAHDVATLSINDPRGEVEFHWNGID
jgi:hypothetical protein